MSTNNTDERRPIPGYEGLYEMDRDGNVYAMFAFRNFKPGRINTTRINPDGYVTTVLAKDGKGKTRTIHRLLMLTFHPIENPHLFEVNHKDLNKANNALTNLEWATHQENIRHAHRMNAWEKNGPRGETTITAKLTDNAVRQIRAMRAAGMTFVDIGKQFGVSNTTIRDVIIGRSWGHVK